MENKTNTYTVLMANVEKFHNTVLRSDIVKLANQIDQANSEGQLEPLVVPKIADIAEKALTQWKLHIEENEQTDLEDINHLESLEWKKLNAELQSIKSNFSA